jgi:endonuclease/exonuclease/phosphatase family metal-dependent hydrolase
LRLLFMKHLVFLVLIVSAFAGHAEDPVLRLATWNLEHLAARDGAGCRPRTESDYARLRYHAARMEADVIALQEVENAEAVKRVFDPRIYAIEISTQPDRDLGACRRRPNENRTAQRTGFAINRARLAELGLTYRRLPDFTEIGADNRRWATHVRLGPKDRGGERLHLLSLHLKSGCSYGRLTASVRRHQCQVLIRQRGILEEWIDGRAAADERFVLLGDFNRQLDQPEDRFWADIDDSAVCAWRADAVLGRRCLPGSGRANSNADLVLANAGIPFPFPYNPRYPYAVDHFVFDGPSARRIVTGSYSALDYEGDAKPPSDHHPLLISLRLRRRQ